MEENISREAGADAGQYTSPEEFQSHDSRDRDEFPQSETQEYSRMQIKLPVESPSSEYPLVPSCQGALLAEFA
jgi:hypothetical protein